MEWYILVLGTIFFGTIASIIQKKTLYKEHAMEFSTVFALFTAMLILPFIPFLNLKMSAFYWTLLIIMSILDAVGFLYLAKAVRHMQISSLSPLLAFGPVFIAILGFLFLGEMLSSRQIGGVFLVFLGSYVLELKHKKTFKEEFLRPFKVMLKSKYIHYIFLALALYSISAIIIRFLLNSANPNHLDPISFIVIFHLLIAVNFIILISIFHDGFKGIMHGIKNAGGWIAAMAFIVVIARFMLMFAIAMPAAKIALVSALKRTTSLFSTFFGGEIFKEKGLKKKTLAAFIMLIGAMLVIL